MTTYHIGLTSIISTRFQPGFNPEKGFDTLWPVVGYSRKDNAVALLNTICAKNVDFEVFLRTQGNPQGGRATYIQTCPSLSQFCPKTPECTESFHQEIISTMTGEVVVGALQFPGR